jgi:hypothetical protein
MSLSTILTAKRRMRLANHQWSVREFLGHQATLAASAFVLLLGSLASEWMLVPAMLCIQAGSVYALRFRRTGCKFMTRRSIWIGATPVDEQCGHLLDGWHP